MSKVVSIIGQGYVGLPLAILIAQKNFKVFGIDQSVEKVNALNSGKSMVEDVTNEELQSILNSGNYKATNNYSCIKESQVVIVCVPTPLNKRNLPDLTFLEHAITQLGKFITPESLVVIESTIAPGTMRNLVSPIIKRESGLTDEGFYLAYSPERIDPLNKEWTLESTPKLLAGMSEIAFKRVSEFYSEIFYNIVECSSVEIAEMAKLLENSFRLINISFFNEISILSNKIGIEVNEVISAASTKPYGFMPFYPGLGAGGHCIPVDPIYLSNFAQNIGNAVSMIELASKINHNLPMYFVSRAEEILNSLRGKRILIVGISYKKNLSDVRESPAIVLIEALRSKSAVVFWHDDLVNSWNNEKSVEVTPDYDLAIIATRHDYLKLDVLRNIPVLDTNKST